MQELSTEKENPFRLPCFIIRLHGAIPCSVGSSAPGSENWRVWCVLSVLQPRHASTVDTLNYHRCEYVRACDALCWIGVTFMVYFSSWSMCYWNRPLFWIKLLMKNEMKWKCFACYVANVIVFLLNAWIE